MDSEKPATLYIRPFDKLDIETIKLEGYLITKPTVQIVSSDKAIVHLLFTRDTDYAAYKNRLSNTGSDSEMPLAYPAVILASMETIDHIGLHRVGRKSKIYVECLNTPYHEMDIAGNSFKINRLIVFLLKVLPDESKKSAERI